MYVKEERNKIIKKRKVIFNSHKKTIKNMQAPHAYMYLNIMYYVLSKKIIIIIQN